MSREVDRPDGDEVLSVRGLVSGRVQGVGFRWHVVVAARVNGVSGDVRNLPDGRVEFRARGRKADVERLLDAVRRGPSGSHVERMETNALDPILRFSGFDIRF